MGKKPAEPGSIQSLLSGIRTLYLLRKKRIKPGGKKRVFMAHTIDLIIPVYNNATGMGKLVAQLERQIFRDFRAVFVDDGSTDGSLEALEKALKDASFAYLLLHQENAGAGAARNTGMSAVTAQWIAFMDCDDGMSPEHLQYMLRAAQENNAEMAVCGIQMLLEGTGAVEQPVGQYSCNVLSCGEAMEKFYRKWVGTPCILLNADFQKKHQLFFDGACRYHEDIPFLTTVLAHTQKVAWLDLNMCLYYAHKGSLSRSPRMDKFESGIRCFEQMSEKVGAMDTEAAAVFRRMGKARYYIATMRVAAVQVDYPTFCKLGELVKFRRYRKDIPQLTATQRLAAYMLLFSRRLFYTGIRMMFRD